MIDENYIIKVAELMDAEKYPQPATQRSLFEWDENVPIITVETEI